MIQLTCRKGCTRPVSRYTNGVIGFTGPSAYGAPERKHATAIVVPSTMRADFDDMVCRTSLCTRPPSLEFFDDLHGVGGMFVPGDWAILVGIKDQRAIAATVVSSWPQQVAAIYAQSAGRWPTPTELSRFALDAAIRRCMAHEIGHALIVSGYPNRYQPDEEAGADYYAGEFDAVRGKNRALGEMFFFSIGCTGPSCTHPAPTVRAAAYRAGYDVQARAA